MSYSRKDAESFANAISVIRVEKPSEPFWEVAAERAGIPTRDLRVIRDEPDYAFLLDEVWVVELHNGEAQVREWEGKGDALHASAERLDAFEDLS